MRKLRERPMQIYLRPDQDSALRVLAQDQKVSMAELVRRSVDLWIEQLPAEQDPLMGIIGLGAGGKGDVSEKHDQYLVEIYKQEVDRWPANSLLTPARGSRSRKRTTSTMRKRKTHARGSNKK